MRKLVIIFSVVCFIATNIVCTKSTTGKAPNTANNAVAQNDATGTKVTYIIKKGAHYCSPNPLTFTSQSQISFKAVFDSSCIYQTVDPANQNDINKFYGFSDCNTQHLENSARIGWRWSKDSLRIFGFVHNNSEM